MSNAVQAVFVVDDDASFLRSIERLLRSCGYSTESFTSASDFLARYPRGAAGCVLADLHMPGMNGLEFQVALAQLANPPPVVFLTGQGNIPSTVMAMRRGAEDFLAKTAPKEAVIDAIERALARNERERQARSSLQGQQTRLDQLTTRERQVLLQVLKGRLNKQIAFDMGVNERSVKRHRTNLMRKLGVKLVAELVQFAVESGMTNSEPPN